MSVVKLIKKTVSESRLANQPSGVQSKNNLIPTARQRVRRSPGLVNQVNSPARYNEEEVDLLKIKAMKKVRSMKSEQKDFENRGKTMTGKAPSTVSTEVEDKKILSGQLR
jgi:hypothetical protein